MGLFGIGGRQTESEKATSRVTAGVKTLLGREASFDPDTRRIFWSTHFDKSLQYVSHMAQAIQTYGIKPLCSGPEVAEELLAMLGEIGKLSDALPSLTWQQACSDENALRALVFSNCIAYIATYKGKQDSISVQWQAYLGTLRNLGLAQAA